MTRCDWAGCKRPSAAQSDGWEHCAAHLPEHYMLTGRRRTTDDLIRLRNSQGWSDVQIADELGLARRTVTTYRQSLGLPAVGRDGPVESTPCGTASAYRRHQRHGQTPCEPCRQAEARRAKDRRAS